MNAKMLEAVQAAQERQYRARIREVARGYFPRRHWFARLVRWLFLGY
jgi:hypothetical protein